MTSQRIHPAIMIGGAGTRLWPLSRGNKPKQFLNLIGSGSLFQDTLLRFADDRFAAPWLMSNAATLHHAYAQLSDLGRSAQGVVVEPCMQGTAAAIAALALVVGREDPETLILAAPADHVIERPEQFRDAVERAVVLARSGLIVTFGIAPTYPETGFGYIRPGAPVALGTTVGGYRVETGGFLEKPPREKAEAFIDAGYLWNAGIFLFKASAVVEEFNRYAPATLAAARLALQSARQRKVSGAPHWLLDAGAFATAPKDLSFDNAIMELTDKAAVIPCDQIGWSDVGSLSALWDIARHAIEDNVLHGDALCMETTGSLVYAFGGRKVVTSHLKDMMIVDTEDCVIVLPRAHAQEVRAIVRELKATGSPELDYTRQATLEWGTIALCDERATHFCVTVDVRAASTIEARIVRHDTERWIVTAGQLCVHRRGQATHLYAGDMVELQEGDLVLMQTHDEATSSIVVFMGMRSQPLSELLVGSHGAEQPPLTRHQALPGSDRVPLLVASTRIGGSRAS